MSEEETTDPWGEYCAKMGRVLSEIEHGDCGCASIRLVGAIEDLLEATTGAPPGVIACSVSVEEPDVPDGIPKYQSPNFFISDATIAMGAPEDVREATAKILRSSWKMFEASLGLWAKRLSLLDEPQIRAERFLVTFVAACYLREFGLWHANPSMPKHMSPEEVPDAFALFSNSPEMNNIIKEEKALVAIHHFNTYGEWPDGGEDYDDV